MRLTNPTLSQRIKIQVQLIGVIQDSSAEQATFQHQVLYKVQDHALDLNLPNSTGDALLMFTDQNHGPAIVNIPRMISNEELSSIVPLEWITNYERIFPQHIADVHTTMPPTITRAADGTIKTVFQKPGTEGRSSFSEGRPSFRRICTISPFTIQHTNYQNDPPVNYFENENLVYVSHINGHFIWDVDPVYSVPCVATIRSYDEEFPPLRVSAEEQRAARRPYVVPQGVTPQGYQAITPQEEVLKWHTDNAISQNKMMLRIDNTLDTLVEKTGTLTMQVGSVEAQINELTERLSTQAYQLDHNLKAYIQSQYFGPEFQKKN
ncbi:hypothetical protein PIB30_059296 [Stylosanthes scabra]|uniref:Uncharacterized protein n=1 Tax=Stylosanthes scabra TaxID=79078 RepID=A0ABU6TK00_9FABA|nr:hypothetical protein [Stylosanthes scabra]